MGLNGELEDLPFVDIVQVVSLGRRTGRLRIHVGAGREAVIGFRDGLIVFARTWKTPPLASQTLPAAPEEREALTRGRVKEALRTLVGLPAGKFEFQVGEVTASSGKRPRFDELRDGLDAQGAILDLLREMDEDADRSRAQPAPSRARVDLGDGRMMAEFKRRLEAILVADPASRYSVGIAYKEMGLLDDAIRELERATHDPRFAMQGFSMLGVCHLEKGEPKEAVRWLEKALALPDRPEHEYQSLRILLALACSAAGRVREALALYEQFARRGLGFAGVAERVQDMSLPQGRQVLPFPRAGSR
jgi:uncharacterized protein DUF4388/tetratricopeptide repeat protein